MIYAQMSRDYSKEILSLHKSDGKIYEDITLFQKSSGCPALAWVPLSTCTNSMRPNYAYLAFCWIIGKGTDLVYALRSIPSCNKIINDNIAFYHCTNLNYHCTSLNYHCTNLNNHCTNWLSLHLRIIPADEYLCHVDKFPKNFSRWNYHANLGCLWWDCRQ